MLSAALLAALLGGSAARAATLDAIGAVSNANGAVLVGGVYVGSYVAASSDPLVSTAGVPGPGSGAKPSGDFLNIYSGPEMNAYTSESYDFSLSQFSSVSISPSLIQGDGSTVNTLVTLSAGEAAPFVFRMTLPSIYAPSVTVTGPDGPTSVYGAAFYDTTDFQTFSMQFSTAPTGELRYKGTITFADPALSTQVDTLVISGTIKESSGNLAPFVGQTELSDSDTFSINGGTGANRFGVTGKATSVGLVPEPSAYAMMILGVGVAGGALRGRRRAAAAANRAIRVV